MSDTVHLSILTNVGLEFEVDGGGAESETDNAHTTLPFQIIGPERAYNWLTNTGVNEALRGLLSPKALVTVPRRHRRKAGIPLFAYEFAFVYPSLALQEQLVDVHEHRQDLSEMPCYCLTFTIGVSCKKYFICFF